MPANGTPIPVPAPFGGINTREGIGSLQPHEARDLVNFAPEGNAVQVRKGCVTRSAGGISEEPVETLASYSGLTKSALIGIGGGSIHDYSSGTAVLLSSAGYASSRFQTECYNNRLIGVNGTDTPWSYNGSTVSNAGFSGPGLNVSRLVNVRKVRNRLWFCEKNSADVWYGGLGSITGALTKFQLSQVVGGGVCIAVGAHSQDAGDGPDDYTCFVMSTGEAVLYSGDPSTTFAKVGNYFMPPPVGYQCLVNMGGPLAVLTRISLVPLQAAVNGIAFDILALGNYGKVGPSLSKDAEQYGSNAGWQAVFHEGKVIINVPVEDGKKSKQWVYNSLTGAWTSWAGFDAASFCVHGPGLYFGLWADGKVKQVAGTLDDSKPIRVSARSAYASVPGGQKLRVKAARFDMAIEGTLTARFGLDIDYIERSVADNALLEIAGSVPSTPWGSPWGSPWSDSIQYGGQWFSTFGEGRSAGLAIEGTASVTRLDWLGSTLLAQPGGAL